MADRYQERPFPSAEQARGEGDPLAELARLIGQNDPLAGLVRGNHHGLEPVGLTQFRGRLGGSPREVLIAVRQWNWRR